MFTIWISILKFIGNKKRQNSIFWKKRSLEIAKYAGNAPELSDQDADLLGDLVELPHWKAFLKYLAIEKGSVINNGLVTAVNDLELGEIKGNISRINKTECDMMDYNIQMQGNKKLKEIKQQDQDVEGQEEEGDTVDTEPFPN